MLPAELPRPTERGSGQRAVDPIGYPQAISAFSEVASWITDGIELDSLLHLIAERICMLLSIKRCSVYLKDSKAGVFRGQVAHSNRDIDLAIKTAMGYAMGPMELLDLIGMDTQKLLCEAMHGITNEPRAACPPACAAPLCTSRWTARPMRPARTRSSANCWRASAWPTWCPALLARSRNSIPNSSFAPTRR